MADTENFVSQLPQPTRYGVGPAEKQLTELSASTNNTRNGAMLPPPVGHKRQGSNLPEPAPKRKTLVERAGEPIKPAIAAPRSIAPVNPAIASAIHARNNISSSSFSQTYRSVPGAVSRNTSTSSFSASVGSGIRPPLIQPPSQLGRPKTSLAKDRSARVADVRPATSLDTRGGVSDGSKHKRMAPTPSMCARHLNLNRPNGAIHPPLAAVRQASLFVPKRDARAYSAIGRWPSSNTRPESILARRDISITSMMRALSLRSTTPEPKTTRGETRSKTPLPMSPTPKLPWNPLASPSDDTTSPPNFRQYLTKSSPLETWDPEEQYGNMERMYQDVCEHYKQAMEDNVEAKEANNVYKSTITNLEQERKELTQSMIALRSELETLKFCLAAAERSKEEQKKEDEAKVESIRRQHRMELDGLRQALHDDIDRLKVDHRDEIRELKRRLESELESERTQRVQVLAQVSAQGAIENEKHHLELAAKEHEIRSVQAEMEKMNASLEREKMLNDDLRGSLTTAGANAATMESARQALQAKIEFLESDSKSQSEAYAAMERRMNEALEKAAQSEEKLRKEETLRRKLHNQVQELKGNIRVFCRVRPIKGGEEAGEEETAKITFPDEDESKEIEVKGPEETSSLGKTTTKTYPFTFDRVFTPSSTNSDIFEEISQLIQSALDGYNVCIFAYGQTGSGKTFTMSSEDGMIPRALRQIYSTSKELGSRGWKYGMEGSFIEVYNEEIRDLLGNEGEHEKGAKKHEIRHDMLKCETTITDVTTLNLDSQEKVEGILAQAMARRSVAATKANEHSSRSHSVFILKLAGHNTITGEKTEGTLNLVDLAGSERLSHSKVEGARLKETQNINKSLSCLGDVIGALGQQQANSFNPRENVNGANGGGGHIPYRNSKLTYLLQFSLGGNSKTLMFVMVAPEKKCLGETITSLKFAEKVSRTKVGVAKKTGGK